MCTASSIASLLIVIPGDQGEHFRVLFGGEERHAHPSSVFAVSDGISASIAIKLSYIDLIKVHACKQGLLFIPPAQLCRALFLLHTMQYAMAASPDALLGGDGWFQALLEVIGSYHKYKCLLIEKDNGRGWVWSPFKQPSSDICTHVKNYAVPSPNGHCPGQHLLTCLLGH